MAKIYNWIPALIVALIIFVLSSLSGSIVQGAGLGKQSYHINGHFILYFLLYVTLYKATKDLKLSLILALLYSITDEIHQLFIPGRSWQYLDLIVDFLGALLGYVLIWKYNYILPNKLRNWLEN